MSWPSLLGELAPGSHLVTMAADPSEGSISFEKARQGGADWDLIVDAGAPPPGHRRIDVLLALLPRLRPKGLYLLIEPADIASGKEDGDLLNLLYTLSDMLNGRRLPPAGQPAVSSEHLNTGKVVLDNLHDRVNALVGSIEIVSSGAILRRAAASVGAPPPNLELSFSDLKPYVGLSGAPAGTDGQCTQTKITALNAELQRLSVLSERQSADIVALEKERIRLTNRRLFRLTAFVGNVTGAPRGIRQRTAHLAIAVLRRALAIPRVRTLAYRLRNVVSR
ncbi:hypothetical protein [Bradyrhizobium sp. LHD-71]|uniref:hypothetical protein n=1 Tax=Bradyrhizobium sp. LHD-71 TaxID=3072141 RepID=UPI00281036DD|nr:hypothetical protein [Bradyrhizobium sp. LHD-71]MDQ8728344.1 hypothetical protein [Bradyrhizobium sp. LHD-71]